MDNEIVEIVKVFLSLAVSILCLVLSRYRAKENEKYATKYKNNATLLLLRLLLTWLLKGISIIMLVGVITNRLDIFIAFYILTPTLIALNLMFFNTDWMKGVLTFTKGVYYLGLTVILLLQFLLKNQDVAELALGFTLALAIFESITALSEGYLKMYSAKNKQNTKNLSNYF
jgi:hypothetical protein